MIKITTLIRHNIEIPSHFGKTSTQLSKEKLKSECENQTSKVISIDHRSEGCGFVMIFHVMLASRKEFLKFS